MEMMAGKKRQIISRVLIVAFTIYYANICFFYHNHVINGNMIVHSHFHSKAHKEKGTHSEGEFKVIVELSAFHSLQATLCFIGVRPFLFLQAIIGFFLKDSITLKPVSCISLRAPPSLY
ncbi:MAG: hypothetical protein AB2L24_13795 [Mangrovibacterium sp.]